MEPIQLYKFDLEFMNGLEINQSNTNDFDLQGLKVWSFFCILLFTDRKVNHRKQNTPAPSSLKHITS